MRPGARVAAAIEVFAATADGRQPIAEALREWGRTHRFAGSKDRAAIAGLAYDMLRRRASSAAVMEADDARGVALGTLHLARGMDA
ncbi:MAG: MFS transporter, partial [Pseudomonadota bacterium]